MAVVVGVLAGAVALRGILLPTGPRVLVYGDSLMVESQQDFRDAARRSGAGTIRQKIWSGTAPCDWVDDVAATARDFKPVIAVIGFSGNPRPCMAGGDLVESYRRDVTVMVAALTAAGARVYLVEEPATIRDTVDAAGRTQLGLLWEEIASTWPNTTVVRASLAVTDQGRFTPTLPCEPEEPCGPDGRITVRAPDGVHFCPHPVEPAGICAEYSSGARRYGLAVARGVFG
ncbi:DUF459 domain-containing protein [Frankia nepalensis]|uniref:SGNH domain-containing protein n=2 Tax=Frankia nepalensis TaxID=1836974 RepID=A0A937R8H3_9ACTN|nr:hypothetical protein [Frankia nepalensis]MBL7496317.1 hypothetical protein [Frankia nepalensis]MBL7627618.1 hypothetical protein [Frankia nepalensis]